MRGTERYRVRERREIVKERKRERKREREGERGWGWAHKQKVPKMLFLGGIHNANLLKCT